MEEVGGIGVGIWRRPVVSGGDQGVGLGFFFGFALDKADDVGMVHIKDDHLGGAAGLATGLDDAGKGVKTLHEAERAAGRAAAGGGFWRCELGGQNCAEGLSALEEHTLRLAT